MKPATLKQLNVLEYIVSFQQEYGWVPSMKEITQHFGWASRTAALSHIKGLRARGYISDSNGRARAYRVLKEV